jgi:Ca-activated chloride channel family protein
MIKVVCASESEVMLSYLAKRYNSLHRSVNSKQFSNIKIIGVDTETLLQKTLSGETAIIVPNSSLLLDIWEQRWREQHHDSHALVRELNIFAASPLVIGIQREIALLLGFPKRSLGWSNLLEHVRDEIPIRLAHASIQSGSGLLSILAMFYVGAKKNSSLTAKDVQSKEVQNFVQALEKTVQEYGASDRDVINRVFVEGKWRVDAIVAQEQAIIQFAQKSLINKMVLIFPREGTLWADYPLTLLSGREPNEQEVAAYHSFSDYLSSADAQAFIPRFGFRPVGPQSSSFFVPQFNTEMTSRYESQSPAVTFDRPQAALPQIAAMIWPSLKRRTTVMLVSDVSGSMDGEKLAQAQKGLLSFVEQFESEDEEMGFIVFSDDVQKLVPVNALRSNRSILKREIIELKTHDRTALLDAINVAYNELQERYSPDRIQAIVVMTDGLENVSQISLSELIEKLRISNRRGGHEVAIFCIAYGQDADLEVLNQIASVTGGSVVSGTLDNIQNIYRQLSQLF